MRALIESGLFGLADTAAAYIIGAIVCVILPYIIGSVNFTARAAKKYGTFPDTTGIILKAGWKTALAAGAADLLKGAFCAMLGLLLMPGDGYAGVCALTCVIGQTFPLFSRFRGGGGGAVYIGAALVINPLMALAALLIGFCIYLTSGWISLGTIVFSCIFPFVTRKLPMWSFEGEESRILLINSLLENLAPLAISLAVVLIYASYIGRMMSGDEPRIPLINKKTK